jgi:hypothetical protein
MAERIIVDLGYVLDLRADISGTTTRLRRSSDDTASIDSAPDVNYRLRDLLNDCDERRGELAGVLASVEDALQCIHDSFTQTEDELVAAITESGG